MARVGSGEMKEWKNEGVGKLGSGKIRGWKRRGWEEEWAIETKRTERPTK